MATANRQQDFITLARRNSAALWNALNDLEEQQKEWNAQDYGNTLADGAGANTGVTKAMVGAAVFDAANALRTVMNAGSATNISNLL